MFLSIPWCFKGITKVQIYNFCDPRAQKRLGTPCLNGKKYQNFALTSTAVYHKRYQNCSSLNHIKVDRSKGRMLFIIYV